MYFSRAVLREDAAATNVVRVLRHDGYAAHQLVWRLFAASPDQERDFLFRDELSHRPTFYLVSARPPQDVHGVWDLDVKLYAPRLKAGDRLRFRLRANPVRSTRNGGGAVKRHDVVMDLKTRLSAAGEHDVLPPLPAIVHEAGFRWLSERADRHGFQIDEATILVDGYRQHRLRKGRQQQLIRVSTLDFSGQLTVTEPTTFVDTLYRGLGPAKGFGCGLLMVKRS